MSENKESERPSLGTTIRHATAFAYGYALTMWSLTKQAHYEIQAKHLKDDLILFGCFIGDTDNLKSEYFTFFSAGSDKAAYDDGAEIE